MQEFDRCTGDERWSRVPIADGGSPAPMYEAGTEPFATREHELADHPMQCEGALVVTAESIGTVIEECAQQRLDRVGGEIEVDRPAADRPW